MSVIAEVVLAKDKRVGQTASSYINDVLVVNEDVASAKEVVEILRAGGLRAKDPEQLGATGEM